MTVSSREILVKYEGNGESTLFPVPFRVPGARVIQCYVGTAGSGDLPLETGNFQVLGAEVKDESQEVRVLYPASPAAPKLQSGEQLYIRRLLPLVQQVELEEYGPFRAETHERKFDWLCMTDQQLQAQIDRCLQYDLLYDGPVLSIDELIRLFESLRDAAGSEADRSRDEADRSEDAARRAEEAAAFQELAGQTINIRKSWALSADISPGESLLLPAAYFPGRHMVFLMYNSFPCTPLEAAIEGAEYQYAEVGEASETSSEVILHFAAQAGDVFDVWILSSITQQMLEEITALYQQAADNAQAAQSSAQAAAGSESEAAGSAQAAAEAAAAAENAAGQAAEAAAEAANEAVAAAVNAAADSAEAAAGSAAQAEEAAQNAADSAVEAANDTITATAEEVATAAANAAVTEAATQIVGEIAGEATEAAAAEAVAAAMSAAVETAVTQIESEISDNQAAAVTAIGGAKDEALAAIGSALEAVGDEVETAQAAAEAAQAANEAAQLLAGAPVIQSGSGAVAANSDYPVPAYTAGTGRLEIFIDGLRAEEGDDMYQYREMGAEGEVSAVIQFHDDYPAETVITALSRG
jgi:hypothetical protein